MIGNEADQMFGGKFGTLFKRTSKPVDKKKTVLTVSSTPQKTIDPVRIGDIGEHKVNIQLDQFPKDCRHISDILLPNLRSKTGYAQIDHILITPHAIFVIETKNYEGSIRGKRNDLNWRVNAKFNMYNPIKQNDTHIRTLKGVLPEFRNIPFVSIVSFTMRCKLNIDEDVRRIESDVLVVYDVKLTDYIERKLIRFKHEQPTPPLSDADVLRISELISASHIADPQKRAEHNRKAGEVRFTK